jgi:N-methylhydantoinase A
MAQEGFAGAQVEAALDLRYGGQSYELTVPLMLPISAAGVAAAVEAFHGAHAQRYGYAMADEPVTVVTLRVVGRGPGAHPQLPRQPLGDVEPLAAFIDERALWFSPQGPTTTPAYDRSRLQTGNHLRGPALVLQYDATVLIAPGWTGRVDELGNLWLDREAV